MPKVVIVSNAKKEFAEIGIKLKDEYDYDVSVLQSEKEVLERLKSEFIDFVIIDLELKTTDAILLCSDIRALSEINQPFIIITSERTEDYVQTAAFDSGADSFLPKPIKSFLIIARIKAMMKRKSSPRILNTSLSNKLIIDTEKHLVVINSKEIVLAKKEFNLLYLLYSNPEKIFTRAQIAKHIWGDVSVGERERRTIDVHLSNIRNKIGDGYIRTVSGIGYIFNS